MEPGCFWQWHSGKREKMDRQYSLDGLVWSVVVWVVGGVAAFVGERAAVEAAFFTAVSVVGSLGETGSRNSASRPCRSASSLDWAWLRNLSQSSSAGSSSWSSSSTHSDKSFALEPPSLCMHRTTCILVRAICISQLRCLFLCVTCNAK